MSAFEKHGPKTSLQSKIPKTGHLASRISAIVLLTTVMSASLVACLGYTFHKNASEEAHGDAARMIALSASAIIDPKEYVSIMESGEKNAYWEELKHDFDAIIENTGALYLYALDGKYGDTVTYFVEGSRKTDPDEPIDFLDSEDISAHADELFEVIESGVPAITDIYDSEGFGRMVSGYAPILSEDGKVLGVVGADIAASEVFADVHRFGILLLLALLFAGAVIGALMRMYVMRSMGKPISELSACAGAVARGCTDINVSDAVMRRNDEIGELARDFAALAKSAREQAEAALLLASGDLTAKFEKKGEMGEALARMRLTLHKSIAHMDESSRRLESDASFISDGAKRLAEGSMSQADETRNLSERVTGISKKAEESAGLSGEANALLREMLALSGDGAEKMAHLVSAADEIKEASHNIDKVIKTIDDIAFRTNILALNAAMEAARAGEAGRGFSAVASEVGALANKSKEAAGNTKALIETSILKADTGAGLAEDMAKSLTEIISGIEKSGGLIAGMSDLAGEQAEILSEIAKSVTVIEKSVLENTAASEENAAASAEINEQASKLAKLVSGFKIE
jgi:methyl-accepting chemotaxis protein